jgi:septin family protein
MASYTSNNQAPFTVFVEGNIGSGKTTFLNHFRKFQNVCLLTEPVDNWRDLKVIVRQFHLFLPIITKQPRKSLSCRELTYLI